MTLEEISPGVEGWYKDMDYVIECWEEQSEDMEVVKPSAQAASRAGALQREVESMETKFVKRLLALGKHNVDPNRVQAMLLRIAQVKERLARVTAGK